MKTEKEIKAMLRLIKKESRDSDGEPTDQGEEGKIMALEWVLGQGEI